MKVSYRLLVLLSNSDDLELQNIDTFSVLDHKGVVRVGLRAEFQQLTLQLSVLSNRVTLTAGYQLQFALQLDYLYKIHTAKICKYLLFSTTLCINYILLLIY